MPSPIEPVEILDQPQARGLTFSEQVTELQQITIWDTAVEIARIEYGPDGAAVAMPLEPDAGQSRGDGELARFD